MSGTTPTPGLRNAPLDAKQYLNHFFADHSCVLVSVNWEGELGHLLFTVDMIGVQPAKIIRVCLRAKGVVSSNLAVGQCGGGVAEPLSVRDVGEDPLLVILEPAATLTAAGPIPHPELFFLGFSAAVMEMDAGVPATNLLPGFTDAVGWLERLSDEGGVVVEAPLPLVRDARELLENQGVECLVEINGSQYPGTPVALRIGESWAVCEELEIACAADPLGAAGGAVMGEGDFALH